MKKVVVLLLFGCYFTAGIFAQNSGVDAEGVLPEDTIRLSREIKKRAEEVFTLVFKPVPTLNNADSIVQVYDDLPSFGIYKDNYVVTGTSLFTKPTRYNSDAKFQISFMQRMTNSVLPLKTYLFLTYTQLAYWDIYRESFPFGDINYNPTIGLGKALAYKNRFLGTIDFQLEHESNGRAGDDSRSWNKISATALIVLDDHWSGRAKLWIPLVDGGNNRDIVSYKGWGQFSMEYRNREKYKVGLLLTKRAGHFFDTNVVVNFSYRLFKHENQYLFMEYYNGYGENMLSYKQYRHRLRLGFVIQPTFLRLR
ncbi:phospholipase A [Viscerimonas tarda]